MNWLDWIKKLQAISQNGLAYSNNPYDLERYQQLRTILAEMIQHHTGRDMEAIGDFLSHDQGYMTPKVDVRGVVFRNNKILLVKERSDKKWTLPGGWADVCLSPGENVVKEIQEESGFRTKVERLLAVYDRDMHSHLPKFPFHVYKFFFLCEIIGGKPQTSIETEAVDFFGEQNIPELSLTKVTPQQISRMFEFYRNDTIYPDID